MNKRILDLEPTGVYTKDEMIGAKVQVKSLSLQNGQEWKHKSTENFTIKDIAFRISLDGKCFAIITLEEVNDRVFTWKDLEVVEINEEDE